VDPLSVRTLLEPDVDLATAAAIALAAGLYIGGVRRLARRGRRWPAARWVPFAAGLVALLLASQSGLARYDTVLFSVHMAQHLLLGMVAPLLLALGAPVTLALQASRRPTQVALLRILHSRPVAVVTHPVVAWVLFGGTLFVLYFSPLFELSLRNDVVHSAVHLHFLVVGATFFWPLVGLDPVHWRLPHGARLLAILLAVPFHAFVGIAILSANDLLAGGWYGDIARDWGPSALSDQRTAAGILWAVGDVLAFVAAVIVFFQWAEREEREAQRADRRLDAVT
jgi:cytochrome c oxidase assembly factor CtaG